MQRKTLVRILNVAGNVFIFASLLILFFTFGPVAKNELVYKVREVSHVKYSVDPRPGTGERKLSPPNTDFSIVIPKLGIAAPVFADTDPFDSKQFLPVLRRGVAHAKGTAYPGEFGNTYLFAHSTDAFYNVGKYNAVFYLLGKLQKGDEIDIFYKGEKVKYAVREVMVVEASAVKYLGKNGNWNTLTLQTCYPPGTTLKRLVVVADQLNF